jgi:hypothetical protein
MANIDEQPATLQEFQQIVVDGATPVARLRILTAQLGMKITGGKTVLRERLRTKLNNMRKDGLEDDGDVVDFLQLQDQQPGSIMRTVTKTWTILTEILKIFLLFLPIILTTEFLKLFL